jgi:MoaA/NifB/PqqE/SkfB family radical SAM enzyme
MKLRTVINIIKQGYSLHFCIPKNYHPKFGPLKVKFNLSYQCNSRCKYCQRWTVKEDKTKEEISLERYMELIDEAMDLGAVSFTFTGGEPFLQDNLFKLIDYSKKKGATHIHVNTNGSLLLKNADRILDSPITTLAISLDTMKREIYKDIRGVDWIDQIKSGLEYLINNRKGKYPQIALSITITSANINDLDEVLDYAKTKGISAVSLAPFHNSTGKNTEFDSNDGNFLYIKDDTLNPIDIAKFKDSLTRIYNKYGHLFKEPKEYYERIPDFFVDTSFVYEQTCYTPSIILRVDPYGNVNPCEWTGKTVGNIKNKSIKEVWFGKKFYSERKQIRCNNHPPCWASCDTPWNLLLKKFENKNIFTTTKAILRYSKRMN